jgi:cytochrome c-type biogenesis protein CcmE
MKKRIKILLGIILFIGICRLVIGIGILGKSSLYLIKSSSASTYQYFMSVNDILEKKEEMTNKSARISGAVIGESVEYDEAIKELLFRLR